MNKRRLFSAFSAKVGFLALAGLLIALIAGLSSCNDRSNDNPGGNNFTLDTPGAPLITASDRFLTVHWTAVEGAESYNVYLGTGQTPPARPVKTVTETVTALDGLTNKTVYYVWIKAVGESGTSDFSPPGRGIPWGAYDPPATPGRPIIISGIYQLTVNWEECGGAVSYEVYISTTPDGVPYEPIVRTDTTSAVIRNLEGDVIYYVRVRSVSSRGIRSDYSLVEVGQPRLSTVAPASPASPLLSAGNGEMSVSWQAVEGAKTYQIWLGTTDNAVEAQPRGGDIAGLSTAITGLTNGTTYYIWIKAKNDIGTSGFSPYANAKPIGNMGTVTVSPGNQQLMLSWPVVAGADQYEVYYSISYSMPESPVQTVLTTTATISGLTNGLTYYVWVKGRNINGESNVSSATSGRPMGTTSGPTLIAGNNQIIINWTAIAEADQYEIFCGTDVNPPQTVARTVNAPTTTATITGLTNGTNYYVWVRGRSYYGTGAYSDPANAKPIGNMGTVTVSAAGQDLLLNWSMVAGADEYEVYYSATNSRPEIPVQTVTTPTATIGGLTNGTTYYVWVKGKNVNGESNVSTVASGKLIGSTSAPTLIAGNAQISASWTAIAEVNQYEIFCGTGEIPPQTAAQTVNAPATSATITGLMNGTNYNVWVRGKNSSGTGAYSNPANAKPIGNMGTVTVSAVGQGLLLSWTAVTGADEYEVYYSATNSRPEIPVQTVTTPTATIGGLANGTTYYVWVRGINANGAGGVSAVASGRPIGSTSAPTLIASNAQLVASWNAIAGADQYEVFYGTGVNPPQTATQTVNALTTTITGLTNGTSYNVWIRGKNSSGTGAYSAPASAKPIGNVGTVTVSAGDQRLSLSWTAVTGADQYEVYYNTTNTMPGSSAQTVSTTTLTISGLTNGTTYYVWVRGINANGAGGVNAVANGKPLGTPEAPIVISGYEALLVTWTAVAGADEYEVYYGIGTPTTPAVTTAETTATISGLTNGTTYNVRLRAKNANGISDYGLSGSGVPGTPGLYRGGVKIGNQNLDASLTYISANAVSGDDYTIVLGVDESLAPKTLDYSGKTVGITLLGFGGERKITLASNGSMFTVSSGVTLTLDEDTTLVGLSENNNSLVTVFQGELIMNEGSKITGNIGLGGRVGGGIYIVGDVSLFTMNGGTISGNAASSGGGVYVSSGTFTMNGGIISGNASRSTYNGTGGGGVYVYGIFRKLPPNGGGQNSGIIYGHEATGVDADGIQLRNTATFGSAIYHSTSPQNLTSQSRNTTAGETDQIDSTTGRGLSVDGEPPYGE